MNLRRRCREDEKPEGFCGPSSFRCTRIYLKIERVLHSRSSIVLGSRSSAPRSWHFLLFIPDVSAQSTPPSVYHVPWLQCKSLESAIVEDECTYFPHATAEEGKERAICSDKGNAFGFYGYKQSSTMISLSLALVFCTIHGRWKSRPPNLPSSSLHL